MRFRDGKAEAQGASVHNEDAGLPVFDRFYRLNIDERAWIEGRKHRD